VKQSAMILCCALGNEIGVIVFEGSLALRR
jgi:hypothetical protein